MAGMASPAANNQTWSESKNCSQLKEKETASQKFGWQEIDSFLPAVVDVFLVTYNGNPFGSRLKHVR